MNDTERGADSAQWRREHLSALMDGEADADAAERCCAHWREQADARSSWHAYHLIGDVLRSEELARSAVRDAQLLEALRGRLAAEPVVLAPSASARHPGPADDGAFARPAVAARRRSWLAPAAVAAGFMALAGVMVVMQAPTAPARAVESLAAAGGSNLPVVLVAPSAGGTTAPPVLVGEREPVPAISPSTVPAAAVAEGAVIRDVELDRYLAAHKQFGGSSALGVPSGFLRSATLQATAR